MKILDIYNVLDFEPIKAKGSYIWDKNGNKYLDFYGGHAVISIGHSHPVWVEKLIQQINTLPFYSNAVVKQIEQDYAQKLGDVSGYESYEFFACNSGAEAIENALKLASFNTGKSKVLAFNNAFHGRTSGAVAVSGYKQNISEFNNNHNVVFADINDTETTVEIIQKDDLAAVIIEGIQGVGGIIVPDDDFLKAISTACKTTETPLILDEVQSGFGRTGNFFAHQQSGIIPDIICMAKGMGNGFPVGGIIVSPDIKYKKGQLGSTFGGNHMAMAAGLAVLEVMQRDNLINNAKEIGNYLIKKLKKLPKIKEVRGRGLMIAIEFEADNISELRNNLLFVQRLITGHAGTNTIRLLPPLNITKTEADVAYAAIYNAINSVMI